MNRLNPRLVVLLAAAAVVTSFGTMHAEARPLSEPAGSGTHPAISATNRVADSAVPTDTANLGRGLVSLRTARGNFLSWRLLYGDPAGITYAVYRGATRIAITK